MARIKEIVVDALNPPALARFWAAVLDDYAVRPYGEKDLADLASRGSRPRPIRQWRSMDRDRRCSFS